MKEYPRLLAKCVLHLSHIHSLDNGWCQRHKKSNIPVSAILPGFLDQFRGDDVGCFQSIIDEATGALRVGRGVRVKVKSGVGESLVTR